MPTVLQSYWSQTRFTPLFRPGGVQGMSVKLPASVNYYAGTILGEVTATPGTYKAYASGSVDGSQNPALVLEYSCTTDASGNISMGGDFGQVFQSTPAYVPTGLTCRTQDLIGLDANAVTKLGGTIIEGTNPPTAGTWNGTTLTAGSAGIVVFG